MSWCGLGGRFITCAGNASARKWMMSRVRSTATALSGLIHDRDVALSALGHHFDRVAIGSFSVSVSGAWDM